MAENPQNLVNQPQNPLSGAGFAHALPGISPKGLMEALENPKIIKQIAVGDLYYQLGVLRYLSRGDNFSIASRLQYATLLAKLADAIKPEAQAPTAAELPRITINVPVYPPDYRPGLPPGAVKPVIEHDAS
jgi:hypothetical protein